VVGRKVAAIIFLVGLPGCAHVMGYAGTHPGSIHCKGKGVITGTGSLAIGAGAGGAGTDAWTIQADCGDGFDFSQSLAQPEAK
jgi:hypothetical protein